MTQPEVQYPMAKKGKTAFERLNPGENVVVGVICGCVEVMVMQPVLYCKNAVQQGFPLTMNPKILYRGLGISVINMGVATGLQFPLTGLLSSMVKGGEDRKLTKSEQILTGLGGGMLSGVVCAPMELTMIQQQRTGQTLFETPPKIIQRYGARRMLRGLAMTSGREGLYTAGYLGIGPVISKTLREEHNYSSSASKLLGAVIAGVVASTLSHPMDTVKTCMQGDVKGELYTSIPQCFQKLYIEGGLRSFVRGLSFRAARTIGAVFLVDESQAFFAPLLFPARFADGL
ncbi:putative mitochondrial carrier C19G12.05 [Diplonema papillatum]|nr:putative mitochondrial carrier C19G12.05 [Diplonema papillatum]|eukprot:gene1259-1947_t